jgi:hypothetical protein
MSHRLARGNGCVIATCPVENFRSLPRKKCTIVGEIHTPPCCIYSDPPENRRYPESFLSLAALMFALASSNRRLSAGH